MRGTVAVFCASSPIGQASVRQLLERDYQVIAVSRSDTPGFLPDDADVEFAAADYDDVNSLTSVLQRADNVFFQLPSRNDHKQNEERAEKFCRAAVRAGVKRIVYNTTMWAPDVGPCGQPEYDYVSRVEGLVAGSGIPFVVFRPVIFMENLLNIMFKTPIMEEGVFRYCHNPALTCNWIAMDDVARFMIQGLERKDLTGRRITIGGPEALTTLQMIETLSAAMEKKIKLDFLSPYEFGEYLYGHLRSRVAPVERIGTQFGSGGKEEFASWWMNFYNFNNYSPYRPFEVNIPQLMKLIPINMTRFHDWAIAQDWEADPI